LNRRDDAVVGITNADAAADRAKARLAEAGGEFADGVGMKDAVGVDGDDDFSVGVLKSVADGAGLAAVDGVAAGADADVGEVVLGLAYPLVTVVDGAVILGDNFKQVVGIVAAADAFDGLVDRLAFVVAGQKDADGGLKRLILTDLGAREGPLKDDPHKVLDDGDQEAKQHDQPKKYRRHRCLPTYRYPEFNEQPMRK
jgi:hypothetical protein